MSDSISLPLRFPRLVFNGLPFSDNLLMSDIICSLSSSDSILVGLIISTLVLLDGLGVGIIPCAYPGYVEVKE
jgi:hypothetical protein